MTTTHSIAPLPDLATFVRDQLADYLDGLGHVIEAQDERDGFPCLSVEHGNGSTYADIAVYVEHDGTVGLREMTDGWKVVTMRGFTWQAEVRDTGSMHGPIANPLALAYTMGSCEACGHPTTPTDPDFCPSCLRSMVAHLAHGPIPGQRGLPMTTPHVRPISHMGTSPHAPLTSAGATPRPLPLPAPSGKASCYPCPKVVTD